MALNLLIRSPRAPLGTGKNAPDFNGRVPPPRRPTSAAPGSAEKIAVLCERRKMRVSLWHPLDATL